MGRVAFSDMTSDMDVDVSEVELPLMSPFIGRCHEMTLCAVHTIHLHPN